MSDWEHAVTDEVLRDEVGNHLTAPLARELTRIHRDTKPQPFGSWEMHDRGFMKGARAGALALWGLLLGWDSLPVKDAVLELRKGDRSLYYPMFCDPDFPNTQKIWADCPECGRVVVGVEGFCGSCGYDWMG